jgi:co-chaperonin GroES (HSP10)
VNRHVTASAVVVAVGEELAHEVFEGEAALLEDSCFAVLREDDVVGGQGGCGTYADALFSCGNLRRC